MRLEEDLEARSPTTHEQKPSEERQGRPPAWAMLDAPLKQVQTMRLKSLATGNPSEKSNSLGMTVQPRRTPVNPAYLEKDDVSIATCKRVRMPLQFMSLDKIMERGHIIMTSVPYLALYLVHIEVEMDTLKPILI